jgi:hypothetical protein
MTAVENDLPPGETDAGMSEHIRPLVNEILERFNQRQISPSEAGMVVLSLTFRLLEVLEQAPAARRHFILTLINLLNNYLADELQGDLAAKSEILAQEEL